MKLAQIARITCLYCNKSRPAVLTGCTCKASRLAAIDEAANRITNWGTWGREVYKGRSNVRIIEDKQETL